MAATITHQLFNATWRARRFDTSLSPPVVDANTGAVLSGLMMGSSVAGTSASAFSIG
jgi:hypothetical protein